MKSPQEPHRILRSAHSAWRDKDVGSKVFADEAVYALYLDWRDRVDVVDDLVPGRDLPQGTRKQRRATATRRRQVIRKQRKAIGRWFRFRVAAL